MSYSRFPIGNLRGLVAILAALAVVIGLAHPASALVNGEDDLSPNRLYEAYFLRAPDEGGLRYWQQQRWMGTSLNVISTSFAASAEFRARYGTLNDAQFVTLVYQNVLNRAPDAGGLEYWTRILRNGYSRGYVMLGFSDSAEFKAKTGRVGYSARDAVGFFNGLKSECDAWAEYTGNPYVPAYYFNASAIRPVGIGLWLVIDGNSNPFVVDLANQVAYAPWTPDQVLPWEYSFGCHHELVLGTVDH